MTEYLFLDTEGNLTGYRDLAEPRHVLVLPRRFEPAVFYRDQDPYGPDLAFEPVVFTRYSMATHTPRGSALRYVYANTSDGHDAEAMLREHLLAAWVMAKPDDRRRRR